MICINLIPMARRRASAKRKRMARWCVGGGAYVALLSGLCAAAILPGRAGTSSLDAKILEVGAEAATAEKETGAIRVQIESALSRLRAIRRVTGHPDWSILLGLIAEACKGQIVLDLCELEPASAAPSGPPAGAPGSAAPGATAAPAAPTDVRQYILRLNGIGRQQTEIPKFTQRLEEMGLFDRVALLESQSRQLGETEVYGFRIECTLRDSGGTTP